MLKKPVLKRWTDPAATEGLLLVAQRMYECLFDYTLDSYKAPTLNTHTRCRELIQAVNDVTTGRLNAKNLVTLVEELSRSIADDTVAKALLGSHAVPMSSASWWTVDDTVRLKAQAEVLLGFLWNRTYERALSSELLSIVPAAKDKRRIVDLCGLVVVEWIHLGFSKEYLFHRTFLFFFSSKGPPITSSKQLAEFFALFEPNSRSFEVCFHASRSWAPLRNDAWNDIIGIAETPPEPRSAKTKEAAFLSGNQDGVFVTARVKALDARSARNKAERQLTRFANVAACHVHRNLLRWKAEALVWEENRPVVLAPSVAAIHRRKDEIEGLEARFRHTILAFAPKRLGQPSWKRVVSALSLHASAVGSDDLAVQLSTLWAALETVVPASVEDAKIAAVVEALVPVLCREYVAKLLTDLGERLQNAAPDAYNEALAKVVGDGQPQYRLGLLVATKASEQLRLELYGKLDRVPLLRYRLYAMRRAFGTSDSLNETIQAHGRRVAWHLRRVYRSRNLLLHAGEVAPYNDSMVENLHSYFHQTLDTLEKLFSTEPSPVSLDAAFLQIRLDHLAHMRILQAEKKADTDESNLSAFLFA